MGPPQAARLLQLLAVTEAAVAFMDQLNSFNNFHHPEVGRRALELQAAVGEYLR
jgi:hypothetical protein